MLALLARTRTRRMISALPRRDASALLCDDSMVLLRSTIHVRPDHARMDLRGLRPPHRRGRVLRDHRRRGVREPPANLLAPVCEHEPGVPGPALPEGA